MSTMTAQTTQVYSVFVRATPDQLWDAITKPEFTHHYFYGARIESTFEVGAPYAGWTTDHSMQLVDGEVLESERPSRLVTTWRALYDPETAAEPHSRVTWEIEPTADGVTKLTVIHDELEAAPKTAESVTGGWGYILSGLKTFVETGKPLAG